MAVYNASFAFNSDPFSLGAIKPSILSTTAGDATTSKVAAGFSVLIPTWEKAIPEKVKVVNIYSSYF